MKKIISVSGARPNFMKVAPLHRAFAKYRNTIRHLIVHTGQHYDETMSDIFFKDLELPKPDHYLGVGSGSHVEQTAAVMVEFEKVLTKENPDHVIVVGDVNSTVACSMVSVKMGISVSHVEAGLRSFDRTMPEEINRILTDAIADHLFVTEESGVKNLKKEGIDESRIHLVGNVMIDSLMFHQAKSRQSKILEQLVLEPKTYTLVTLHRPSNVDSAEGLSRILQIFRRIAGRTKIVFPIHPRTRKTISRYNLEHEVSTIGGLTLIDPVGYLDFHKLMENASLVLTDSGGIQEETTFLGIPCLTLRENTERPITVEIGTNELCGLDVDKVTQRSLDILSGQNKKSNVPFLWDGKSAERIVGIIANNCLGGRFREDNL